jgi:uncharacterized MAPEG superfamily protein
MNELFWYIPAAYLWAYMGSKIPLGVAMAVANKGRYDNAQPRTQQDALTGKGARLRAAHYNAIAAFPPFAAATLVAASASSATPLMHGLAISWVVFRLIYQWAYSSDRSSLRSVVWAGAVGANLGLFVSAIL